MTGRVVVLGAGGQLGRQLVTVLPRQGFEVTGLRHADLDIGSDAAPARLAELKPDVVVNAAAWTDVDGCARDPARALEANGAAPGRLAEVATAIGARFVQVSTNEVFDGTRGDYRETDAPNPINPYGASKLAGERAVAAAGAEHLVIRTAWIFGPEGNNFPRKIVEAAQRAMADGTSLRVVADEFGNPTWAPDLATRIGEAMAKGLTGILHLAGVPAISRHGWAEAILAGLDVRLEPIASTEFPRASTPPLIATLSMERAAAAGISPMEWREPTSAYAQTLLAEGVA